MNNLILAAASIVTAIPAFYTMLFVTRRFSVYWGIPWIISWVVYLWAAAYLCHRIGLLK